MKTLEPRLHSFLVERHGYAELTWTRSIPIPGDDDFPVLELPEGRLRYETARGYPIKLAARRVASRALLIVRIESFEAAGHAEADWAIPLAYKPQSDDEALDQALGFDEGWEDAAAECTFVCDDRFAVFWRAAVERKRFGLTAPEAMSLYPVTLDTRELDPLRAVLRKWR